MDFKTWDGDEKLLVAGGRWDRRLRRFVGAGASTKVFKLQPAQYDAARVFCAWLRARVAKEAYRVGPQKRIMRALALVGGRRGGKSDLAIRMAVAYALAFKRSRVWLVAPSQPKSEELDLALQEFLPRGWYRRLGAPHWRYKLANGSTITLRSAHDPEDLKRGRADFVVLNEAQLMAERAFAIVRPATSDRGGIVVLTANPPEDAKGQWVAELVEETEAGRRPAKVIHINARLNPTVDQESLDDLRYEVDERTYRMERDGEFLARLDIVFHQWSPTLNVRPTPELGDMTREWLAKRLGREPTKSWPGFGHFAGFDFQLHPFMACTMFKAFRDPEDPDGEPLLWAVDSVAVKGNEDELIDELERRGYVGDHVACIPDASGEWQDAERTRGRGSCDVLRRRRWGHIFLPNPKAKKNPDIVERVAVGNARMCTTDKKRHVFSDPANVELNQDLRKWERRKGVPFRKSQHAHRCDSFTYPLYRFYPRLAPRKPFTYETVKEPDKGGWEDLR